MGTTHLPHTTHHSPPLTTIHYSPQPTHHPPTAHECIFLYYFAVLSSTYKSSEFFFSLAFRPHKYPMQFDFLYQPRFVSLPSSQTPCRDLNPFLSQSNFPSPLRHGCLILCRFIAPKIKPRVCSFKNPEFSLRGKQVTLSQTFP